MRAFARGCCLRGRQWRWGQGGSERRRAFAARRPSAPNLSFSGERSPTPPCVSSRVSSFELFVRRIQNAIVQRVIFQPVRRGYAPHEISWRPLPAHSEFECISMDMRRTLCAAKHYAAQPPAHSPEFKGTTKKGVPKMTAEGQVVLAAGPLNFLNFPLKYLHFPLK